MIYMEGQKVDIQAAKACTLAGARFKKNDLITVELCAAWNILENIGDGGSWGFGGFSARTIKKYAKTIIDFQTGKVIWRLSNEKR